MTISPSKASARGLVGILICCFACSADSGRDMRDAANTGTGGFSPLAGAGGSGGFAATGGSGGAAGIAAGGSGGGGAGSGGGISDQVGEDDPLLGGQPPTGGGDGCQKVDFLFVVDNSGSMGDEQQNLANSFPGFIDAIRTTISAQDYQILVTDTDAAGGTGQSSTCSNGVCMCSPAPSCCDALCAQGGVTECNGYACGAAPPPAAEGCDATLGAGKVLNGNGMRCLPDNGRRYMIDSDPELDMSFTCVAEVGTSGDGNEQPMATIQQALGTQSETGQCNAGFLRDDALLVVTFITDEEDEVGKSPGDPASWAADLLALKGGNQDAIVVVGFFGDNDQAGSVCQSGGLAGDVGADPGYRLREFVEQFDHGVVGSVCAADYAPTFSAAIPVIDQACDTVVL